MRQIYKWKRIFRNNRTLNKLHVEECEGKFNVMLRKHILFTKETKEEADDIVFSEEKFQDFLEHMYDDVENVNTMV